MEGWIKLHRRIFENPYYFSEKFCRSMAWIDLLLLANRKPGVFYKRGIKVEVNIGQTAYDVESLSKRWGWSRGKVDRWLNELEKSNQIVRQKNNVTSLITICNYIHYQDGDNPNSNPNSKANDKANSKPNGQQTEIQTDTNKKEDNSKERNSRRTSFVPPTLDEVKKYFADNGYRIETAESAWNYYNDADWFDSKGNPVLNWKQKMRSVWFKPENIIKPRHSNRL